MRAVGVNEFGGPEALEVVELPEPHAGAGEVRIRVRAATVNPSDTLRRSGALAQWMTEEAKPYVLGMEVAGEVDEIGDLTVTTLAVGDPVMAMLMPRGSRGAYSELLVVPAESAVRTPSGSSFAEAATLPMNGLTARVALDLLGLAPGQILAVTGAAGSVGGYVVQLAAAAGLTVVADASEADEALVRELGATVIVRRGDDVAERIRESFPDGVDGLIDAAVMQAKAMGAVRDGGGFVAVRQFEGTPERDIDVHFPMVSRYATDQTRLEELSRQVEAGALTLRVARTFPLDQAADAHRLLEAGGTRGRIVLEV